MNNILAFQAETYIYHISNAQCYFVCHRCILWFQFVRLDPVYAVLGTHWITILNQSWLHGNWHSPTRWDEIEKKNINMNIVGQFPF